MKLSINTDSPHYHDIVHFVQEVRCDGEVLKYCLDVDLANNRATCVVMPLKEAASDIPTHVVEGQLEIVWKVGDANFFAKLKAEWEAKEKEFDEQAKN